MTIIKTYQDFCIRQLIKHELTSSKIIKYERLKIVTGVHKNKKMVLAAWRPRHTDRPFHYSQHTSKESHEKEMMLIMDWEMQTVLHAKAKKQFIPNIKIGDIYAGEVPNPNSYVSYLEAYQVVGQASKHYAHFRKIGFANLVIDKQGTKEMLPIRNEFIGNQVIKKKITMNGINIPPKPKDNTTTHHKIAIWDGKPDLTKQKMLVDLMGEIALTMQRGKR